MLTARDTRMGGRKPGGGTFIPNETPQAAWNRIEVITNHGRCTDIVNCTIVDERC
jgi:hypothetical protein